MMEGEGQMKNERKSILLQMILSLTAVSFIVIPAFSAFVEGDLREFLTKPNLQRDAVELAVYALALFFLSLLARRKKGIIILAVAMIYLLSMGTLSQCIVSYVYIEILLYIGRSFLTLFLKGERTESAGVSFLAGSMVWGTAAVIMSLLGAGTIEELRILTIGLFLTALLNPGSRIAIDDILVVRYIKYLNDNKGIELLANLFFILIMMISCARVNTYVDYDSYWYALYTDKCLFGDNSFYDFLGYMDFVYYYPKFKELLMAPISGLGLPGYLISVNLWIMVLCVIEVYHFLTESIRENRIQIFSVLYLLFSTVCIVGISGTAKSDALSYLYMLILILYFVRYNRTGTPFFLWISFSAGLMSYTVKYTSFLFSTLVFIVIFIVMVRRGASGKIKLTGMRKSGIVLLLLAAFVLGGILYRTYVLTGYPTYREAKGVWDAAGFQAMPYFGAEISEKPENVFLPGRILTALFDVGNGGKLRHTWTGNYTFFLILCLIVQCRKRENDSNRVLCAITAVLTAASFYFLVTMASPDGNYFSIPIIVCTCYVFIRMTESVYWQIYRNWFTLILGGFLLLNLVFVFFTHPSSRPAVRYWEDTVSVMKTEGEKYETDETELKSLGVYELNEKLKDTDGKRLILADGDDTRACMMNARVQLAWGVFQKYLSGAGIESYEDFVGYVDYVKLDGVLVAKDGSDLHQFLRFREYVARYIAEYGCVEQMDMEKYVFYRLR